MASTDVIRGHARLRLSIKQLFGCKNYGVITSRDLEPRDDGLGAGSTEGSTNDHHKCSKTYDCLMKRWLGVPNRMGTSAPMITGEEPEVWSTSTAMAVQERWRQAPSRMNLTSVPVKLEAEPEVMSSIAAMASKNHNPVSMSPSGVCVGGGRAGEDIINHSSFSSSHLSNMKYEFDCVERLSTLGIADDTRDEILALNIQNDSQEDISPFTNSDDTRKTQNLPPAVTKLLEMLEKFGVQSRPVKYREKGLRAESSEIFCKNLFLKDRRGQLYLVICDENEDIDLKTLRRKLKAYRNFSFVLPEEMAAILKVSPGGVTPFALMHGFARDVRVAVTTDLTTNPDALLNFHPLDQSLTLPVKLSQLKLFLSHFRFELEYLDMKS